MGKWISGRNFLQVVGEENLWMEGLEIVSGYPLDTLRILQQNSKTGSAFAVLRNVVSKEGPTALYRGMAAPLASITFQNATVFQSYAILSRALDPSVSTKDPPPYRGVALGGFGAGALQRVILSPVELGKNPASTAN